MEFGFLTQGYVPAQVRGDPGAEHRVLMDDFDLCLAAEKAGFKYVWLSEHHFLDEYSDLSKSKEQTRETLRLMGEPVIPRIDREPVHRTTRLREAAR